MYSAKKSVIFCSATGCRQATRLPHNLSEKQISNFAIRAELRTASNVHPPVPPLHASRALLAHVHHLVPPLYGGARADGQGLGAGGSPVRGGTVGRGADGKQPATAAACILLLGGGFFYTHEIFACVGSRGAPPAFGAIEECLLYTGLPTAAMAGHTAEKGDQPTFDLPASSSTVRPSSFQQYSLARHIRTQTYPPPLLRRTPQPCRI